MAKDRIDRAELADKLVESATSAEDPLRAMALGAELHRTPQAQ
jgi:hypothetical protein